jgi:hypothetical protein
MNELQHVVCVCRVSCADLGTPENGVVVVAKRGFAKAEAPKRNTVLEHARHNVFVRGRVCRTVPPPPNNE